MEESNSNGWEDKITHNLTTTVMHVEGPCTNAHQAIYFQSTFLAVQWQSLTSPLVLTAVVSLVHKHSVQVQFHLVVFNTACCQEHGFPRVQYYSTLFIVIHS